MTGNDHEQFWSGGGVGDHLADHPTTRGQYHLARCGHIVYLESDVGEPGAVYGCRRARGVLVVTEDLQGRPALRVAGQAQVHAAQARHRR